jgi:hypothetical protein
LETSNESELEELMNKFNYFEEEKKNLLVLIMEVISKMGKSMNMKIGPNN